MSRAVEGKWGQESWKVPQAAILNGADPEKAVFEQTLEGGEGRPWRYVQKDFQAE